MSLQILSKHRRIAVLFPLSVFLMMFDLLRLHPSIPVSFYRVIQIIILSVIIISLLINKNLKFSLHNPTFLLLTGFLAISLLFSLFSADINNTLWAIFQLIQLIILAFIMFLLLKSVWREEYWIYLSTTMLLCGTIAGLSIITDYLGVTSFSSWYHIQDEIQQIGILGEPNFAAGKLGIFLPFALLLWRNYTYRGKLIKALFTLISSFIIVIAILLTGSRMGGAIAVFTLLIFGFKEIRQLIRFRTIFGMVSAVIIITVFSSIAGFDIMSSSRVAFILDRYTKLGIYVAAGGREITDRSLLQRANLFVAGIEMFKDHVITGIGLANFPYKAGEYTPYDCKYSHNTFISVLAETGFMGILFFLGLFMQVGKNIYRHYRNSSYSDFYFYLGLSFLNLVLMLFFLHDFANKYLWGLFVVLSMYFDHVNRFRVTVEGRGLS